MIKVLHILPGINGGGVGKIVYSYAKHLDKEKITLDVASLNTINGEKPFLYDSFIKNVDHLFLLNRKSYLKRFKELYNIYKKGKYDIIHCHLEEASFFYLLLAMIMGVKIRIAQTHLTTIPAIFSFAWFKSLFRPLLSIICTHKFACGKKAAKKLWKNDSNVYILTNAIEIDPFIYNPETRDKTRSLHGLSPNEFIIGTVGRIDTQKNPFFILKIIKELKKKQNDFKFLWIGEGEHSISIKNELKKNGLTNNVIMLGVQNNVHELMMAMDVFVLPSLYEGLPIVGVEAQVSGLPSLFSNTITNEFKLIPTTEFLAIDDPEAWVNKILSLRQAHLNRLKYAPLIQESIFNIKIAAKALETEYQHFIEKQNK